MVQIIRANYFFTAAFTLEVVLQSIAKNFAFGPKGALHADTHTAVLPDSAWLSSPDAHAPHLASCADIHPEALILLYLGFPALVSHFLTW